MWKRYLKAARYAKAAHAGQLRGHGAPYFEHPAGVARILWRDGHRGAVIEAAYLHDVLEDCGKAPLELVRLFGLPVTRLVLAVTKRKGEPHEAFYKRVREHGREAAALKLADREHNNSELHLLPADKAYMHEKARKKTELMRKVLCDKE